VKKEGNKLATPEDKKKGTWGAKKIKEQEKEAGERENQSRGSSEEK